MSTGRICGFIFNTGYPCHADAFHPIHHNRWSTSEHFPHPEPDHEFQPIERRRTHIDRRSGLVAVPITTTVLSISNDPAVRVP